MFALLFLLVADVPDPIQLDDVKPLGVNIAELAQTLAKLKSPLPGNVMPAVEKALARKDGDAMQEALDERVFVVVTINPEGRVKLARGPADVPLRVKEPSYAIVKVVNQSGAKQHLEPRPRFTGGGASPFLLTIPSLGNLTPDLSGQPVEYRLLKVACSTAGRRELTLAFDAGQESQDLGFRGEVPVLFDVKIRE